MDEVPVLPAVTATAPTPLAISVAAGRSHWTFRREMCARAGAPQQPADDGYWNGEWKAPSTSSKGDEGEYEYEYEYGEVYTIPDCQSFYLTAYIQVHKIVEHGLFPMCNPHV